MAEAALAAGDEGFGDSEECGDGVDAGFFLVVEEPRFEREVEIALAAAFHLEFEEFARSGEDVRDVLRGVGSFWQWPDGVGSPEFDAKA